MGFQIIFCMAKTNHLTYLLKQKIVVLLLALTLGSNLSCKTNNSPKYIQLDKNYIGKTIEKELKSTDEDIYQIKLAKDECFNLRLEQNGIDVAIEMVAPNDTIILRNDNQVGIKGEEFFFFVVDEPGAYKLKIIPVVKTAISGKYSFQIKELRLVQQLDRTKFDGIRLLAEGKQSVETYKTENIEKGVKKLELALDKFQECNNDWYSCIVLNNLGNVYYAAGKFVKASEFYEKALFLSQKIQDKMLEAYSLDSKGLIFYSLGNYEKAIENQEKALVICESFGDDAKMAYLLNNLANSYQSLGNFDEARKLLERAIEIHKKTSPLDEYFVSCYNLNLIYKKQGNYQQAISLAIENQKTSKDCSQRMKGYANNMLSSLYKDINDIDAAISYSEEAIKHFKESGNIGGEAEALVNLGGCYALKKDTDKSLKYYREILTKEELVKPVKVDVLNKIASLYLLLSDFNKAENYFNDALKIAKATNLRYQEGITLLGLGKLALNLADYNLAHKRFQEALVLFSEIGITQLKGETLFNIAKLEFKQGRYGESENLIKSAIDIAESIRDNFSVKEFKILYFSTIKEYYDLYIQILNQKYKKSKKKSDLEVLLVVVEKSRSRSLSEIIKENYFATTTFKSEPLQRHFTLQLQISQNLREQLDLINKNYNLEKLTTLQKQMLDLRNESYKIEGELKQKTPNFVRITETTSVSITQVQNLLDDTSTLLEYYLAPSESFVFVITKDTFDIVNLSSSNEVEDKVRELYKVLSNNTVSDSLDSFSTPDSKFAEYYNQSKNLSKLLIEPINNKLLKKQIIIVANGSLNYLPWSVLPNPNMNVDQNTPLIMEHQIAVLPSISTFLSQKTLRNFPVVNSALVVCDPVSSSDDIRLKGVKTLDTKELIAQNKTRPPGLREGFGRLRFAQHERDAIKQVIPKPKILEGFDATIENLYKLKATRYKIFHFITHAISNKTDASLSSIILSGYDNKGYSTVGYLTLPDIVNLQISADLVILSACQTGIGKEVIGEGMLGFTYAFMSIGATKLITTLWDIDDESTSALMTIFYQKLATGKKPAEALREAQIEIMQQEKWANPFYWAGFTFTGDWN